MEKKMKRFKILLPLLIFLIFFLSSCKEVIEQIEKEIGVMVGNIAQNIIENNSNGQKISLDSFKGKVILLNFSTMWYSPCRSEASHLMELYNRYKERGFEIVQCIYQDEDGNPANIADLIRWVDEFNATYNVLNDPDRSSVNLYQFNGIPFNGIIDRDFVIQYRQAGFYQSEVEQIIESYL